LLIIKELQREVSEEEKEDYHGSNIAKRYQQPEDCHKTIHHFELYEAMSLYSLHGEVILRSTT
jgi:hypothetical protein